MERNKTRVVVSRRVDSLEGPLQEEYVNDHWATGEVLGRSRSILHCTSVGLESGSTWSSPRFNPSLNATLRANASVAAGNAGAPTFAL